MVKQSPIPMLYPPLKVVFLSFLFTPIFGGHLQAQNWEMMGYANEARLSRLWARMSVWLVGLYLVMQMIFVDEPLMKYSGPYFLFVCWLVWFLSSARRQVSAIRALGAVGEGWTPRPIGRPIVFAALCWVLYMMTGVSLGLALSMLEEPASHNAAASSATTPTTADNGVIIRRDSETGRISVEEKTTAAPEAAEPAPSTPSTNTTK